MTFENYQYTRPNVDDAKTQLSNLVTRLMAANSTKETLEIFNEYNKLREHLETMSTLVEIRATIDTTDKFYEGEREFWDEFTPELASLQSKFDKEMYNSKFKDELKKEIGEHYFNLIETTLKVFSDEIIDDLKEENKLSSEHTKLTSSAKIPFDNGEHNLSAMAKYTQDANREIRHAAAKAVAKFFKDNLEQYDSIYDRMIKVRTRIAKKLGFENFVEVAYLRLRRTDYNAKDVANYRKQIFEEIVPLVEKIKKEQMLEEFKAIKRVLQKKAPEELKANANVIVIVNGCEVEIPGNISGILIAIINIIQLANKRMREKGIVEEETKKLLKLAFEIGMGECL